jgi:hypothetical protein
MREVMLAVSSGLGVLPVQMAVEEGSLLQEGHRQGDVRLIYPIEPNGPDFDHAP